MKKKFCCFSQSVNQWQLSSTDQQKKTVAMTLLLLFRIHCLAKNDIKTRREMKWSEHNESKRGRKREKIVKKRKLGKKKPGRVAGKERERERERKKNKRREKGETSEAVGEDKRQTGHRWPEKERERERDTDEQAQMRERAKGSFKLAVRGHALLFFSLQHRGNLQSQSTMNSQPCETNFISS